MSEQKKLKQQEHDRRRSCAGKQNHADPVHALMACSIVYREVGYHVFPYRCRHCPNWHIGHTPKYVREFIAMFTGTPIRERSPLRLTHSLGDALKSALQSKLES